MTTIRRIGFNLNAQAIADVPKLERILTVLQPTTLLVMSDYNYALRLYDLLGGKTKICYRAYRQLNDEGTLWQNIKPAEYVASLIGWGNPKIYRQVLNEPAPFPQNIIPLSDWLIEVMDRLHMAGYRGVIGNFGVGTYQPGQVDGGQFDNLLRAFDKHYDYHLMGVHEYTGVILPFGVGQWPQIALLDRNAVQPDRWPTNPPIKRIDFAAAMESARYIQDYGRYLQQIAFSTDVSVQEVAVLPGYWHFLRSAWFTIRARELGLRDPQFWITEFGWDRVGDIEPIFQKLQEIYGTSGFIEFGRINSLWKLFSDYYGHLGWTPQYTAYQMLAWANRVYPDNYVGMNLFTWSNAHDWRDLMGTDFADLDELHAHLIQAAQTEAPAPVPEPQPIPVPTPVPTPTPVPIGLPDNWGLGGLLLAIGILIGFFVRDRLLNTAAAQSVEVSIMWESLIILAGACNRTVEGFKKLLAFTPWFSDPETNVDLRRFITLLASMVIGIVMVAAANQDGVLFAGSDFSRYPNIFVTVVFGLAVGAGSNFIAWLQNVWEVNKAVKLATGSQGTTSAKVSVDVQSVEAQPIPLKEAA